MKDRQTEILEQERLDAKAINSIKECSHCGRPMPDSGVRGLVKDGVAYSFCSEECCGEWASVNHPTLFS